MSVWIVSVVRLMCVIAQDCSLCCNAFAQIIFVCGVSVGRRNQWMKHTGNKIHCVGLQGQAQNIHAKSFVLYSI